MFDLGLQELIVICVVALLVFGPKRLPELGRTIGRFVGQLKRAAEDVRSEMNSELQDEAPPGRPDTGGSKQEGVEKK